MEQPEQDGEDRLARFLREHIKNGNRPNYPLALEKMRRFDEAIAREGPLFPETAGMTEEEISQFAVKLVREIRREDRPCDRRSDPSIWE